MHFMRAFSLGFFLRIAGLLTVNSLGGNIVQQLKRFLKFLLIFLFEY